MESCTRYRSLFPDAMIYGFEPFADTFGVLTERFKPDDFAKPVAAAVTDAVGASKFYVRGRSDANSLLPSVSGDQRYELSEGAEITEVIEVPTTTIDEYCRNEGVFDIQILKLDVEGSELKALKGARGKLECHQIELIYAELTFIPHNRGEAPYFAVCDFLAAYDYSLFDFYNEIRGWFRNQLTL